MIICISQMLAGQMFGERSDLETDAAMCVSLITMMFDNVNSHCFAHMQILQSHLICDIQ